MSTNIPNERLVRGRDLSDSWQPSGGRPNSHSPSAVCAPASPYQTWGCSWPSRCWSDPRQWMTWRPGCGRMLPA